MIVLCTILPFMIGAMALVIAVEVKSFSVFLFGCACWLFIGLSIYFHCVGKPKDWTDTIQHVHIAENNAAYVFANNSAVNVNKTMGRNFKEGDEVIVRDKKGYWSGHIWMDAETEYIVKDDGEAK